MHKQKGFLMYGSMIISALLLLLLTACAGQPSATDSAGPAVTETAEQTPPAQPGPALPPRSTQPIVSTQWLADNLTDPQVVIVDIRSGEEYNSGHIPGAVNHFNAAFHVIENDLLLEMPQKEDLSAMFGSLGISADSHVIVVSQKNSPTNPYAQADANRAAITLVYAGVRETSILDGGITQWIDEERELSTETPEPVNTGFTATPDSGMITNKQYVEDRIGYTAILDARDPNVYFGVAIEPFAPRPGHIPTARNLPTPWMWDQNGMYRENDVLKAMAEGLLGTDKTQEVLVYCGVGGYGSTLWFVLHDILGYTNVKLYDGSAQEWVADPDAPLNVFSWN